MPRAKKKTTKKKSSVKTRLVSMDDVYRLLNKVQISEKEIKFAVNLAEGSTAENIIKDSGLPYEKKELKTRFSFVVKPDPEQYFGDDKLDVEIFKDELEL